MCRLPANYLIGLYGDKTAMWKYPEIKQYIEANMDRLIQTQETDIKPKDYLLPCYKYSYLDEKIANEQLKIVREDKGDHKKPIRAYQCEKCGFWHLTSKPLNS